MRPCTLLDTGPLVAFLSSDDVHHEWVSEQWKTCFPPFLTCEAVLAEAVFLLRRYGRGPEALFELLKREVLALDFDLSEEDEPVVALLKRYRNVPMSLADACLVRMNEIHGSSRIFTLDSDFSVYRRHGRQTIPLLAPW